MNELILSERMPVLAMRGLVLFPQATMHFDVGREKSVRALGGGDERRPAHFSGDPEEDRAG